MKQVNYMLQINEDKLAYLETQANDLVKEIQALNSVYDMTTFAPSKLNRLQEVQMEIKHTYELVSMLKSLKEEN